MSAGQKKKGRRVISTKKKKGGKGGGGKPLSSREENLNNKKRGKRKKNPFSKRKKRKVIVQSIGPGARCAAAESRRGGKEGGRPPRPQSPDERPFWGRGKEKELIHINKLGVEKKKVPLRKKGRGTLRASGRRKRTPSYLSQRGREGGGGSSPRREGRTPRYKRRRAAVPSTSLEGGKREKKKKRRKKDPTSPSKKKKKRTPQAPALGKLETNHPLKGGGEKKGGRCPLRKKEVSAVRGNSIGGSLSCFRKRRGGKKQKKKKKITRAGCRSPVRGFVAKNLNPFRGGGKKRTGEKPPLRSRAAKGREGGVAITVVSREVSEGVLPSAGEEGEGKKNRRTSPRRNKEKREAFCRH